MIDAYLEALPLGRAPRILASRTVFVADDRAEDPGRGQTRSLGDVVRVGRDLLELHALAVVIDPVHEPRLRHDAGSADDLGRNLVVDFDKLLTLAGTEPVSTGSS